MCGRIALAPRYNIGPTTPLPLTTPTGQRTLTWGFQTSQTFLINSRSDNKYYKHGFSVLLIDGYYEWIDKQPYYVSSISGSQFCVGCVTTGDKFLIVTTGSGPNISKIHDRMPVILRDSEVQEWILCKSYDKAKRLITSKDDDLVYWPVSKHVNKIGNEGFECVKRISITVQPKISSFFSRAPKPDNKTVKANLQKDDHFNDQKGLLRGEIHSQILHKPLLEVKDEKEEYPIDEDIPVDLIETDLIAASYKTHPRNSDFKNTDLPPSPGPFQTQKLTTSDHEQNEYPIEEFDEDALTAIASSPIKPSPRMQKSTETRNCTLDNQTAVNASNAFTLPNQSCIDLKEQMHAPELLNSYKAVLQAAGKRKQSERIYGASSNPKRLK